MKVVVWWLSCIIGVTAIPLESVIRNIEPEYLDKLLEEKKYEEFSDIMGLGNPELAYSKGEGEKSREEAMFNKNIPGGDILTLSKERQQARQGLNFEEYEDSKWKLGYVPYTISRRFSKSERKKVTSGIKMWNNSVSCIPFIRRTDEKDYIVFFPGDGCYSHFGCTGGPQSLSVDPNGCLHDSIIVHEMQHAIGFAHEQNRSDRDEYIEIKWENIPNAWKDQYEKTDEEDFIIILPYDYYSIMHYPVNAPGTNKPAFKVLEKNIDEKRIGYRYTFTEKDIKKIDNLYCSE